MTLTVQVAYRDGSVLPTERVFSDLREAALYAVQLADDLGRTVTRHVRGPGAVHAVQIRRSDMIEFEILVFAGGLSPGSPFRGLIDLPPDSGDEGK